MPFELSTAELVVLFISLLLMVVAALLYLLAVKIDAKSEHQRNAREWRNYHNSKKWNEN